MFNLWKAADVDFKLNILQAFCNNFGILICKHISGEIKHKTNKQKTVNKYSV